jgi:feruloyl esterase
MANILFWKIDEATKEILRRRAERRGKSLEAETPDDTEPFGSWLVSITRPGIDLDEALAALRGLLIAELLAGCAGSASQQAAPVAPKLSEAAQHCAALSTQTGAALGEPTARILSATLNAPSAAKAIPGAPAWVGGIPATPENCEVIGVMRERVGVDGQHYAVKFHVRLPTNWNGRFLFQGGGGTNGVLGDAIGNVQPSLPTGLDQGYAVVRSSDTGHDNAVNNNPARQGTVAFGYDYQARIAGCSNGGREGMVFAQRFPDQFDGILAKAPAFAVPKAAIAEAWDTQSFAKIASHERGA